ncbi:MAG: 16S rRNA (uracil(1498)-N(3))-methyltransferase [Phycisphaerales bacterium]|nr:16S rRNA (uracil(1498)-N(3))-methyltransferase [Phycisphaerales bacterium]
MHRIYTNLPIGVGAGDSLVITGEEAHHAARVKRVEGGEVVQLLDGAGMVGIALVLPMDAAGTAGLGARRRAGELVVRLLSLGREERASPVIEVCSATPKGQRTDDLVDGLSQVGAAAWRPLATAHGVVEPRESKLERLERRAVEASKQSGRPWVMRIGSEISVPEVLMDAKAGRLVVADSTGVPYQTERAGGRADGGVGAIRLLVGPEGGFTKEELRLAREAGATVCAFGPHIMRIEVAAVAACAVVMAAEWARAKGAQSREEAGRTVGGGNP